jgi:hypothetical protein
MRFLVTAASSKLQDLELPPDIDPKDPDLRSKYGFRERSENFIRQAIYIHQNDDNFFDHAEKRVLGKFIEDVEHILEQGWAQEISYNDFYFGRVCGHSKTPLFDMEALFSTDNIALFYYTHSPPPLPLKLPPLKPEHKNRNIVSSLDTLPHVVHPAYRFGEYPFYVVRSEDLGLMSYAQIYFEKKDDGQYQLRNGTRLDIWGLLLKDFYYDLQRKQPKQLETK